MKTSLLTLVAGFLLLSSVASRAQQPSAKTSVPESLSYVWSMVERDFTALAEAMPEDKWNFKPAQGAFSNVRTFGEQVKHVACGNEAWTKKLRGETPPDRCDLGGPNPARTKAEILAYLRESFAMLDKELAGTTADRLLAPVPPHPYAGNNRLEVLEAALWHASDHYGQLVVYLRMNGIVPPASAERPSTPPRSP